jgi:hypothetical protein
MLRRILRFRQIVDSTKLHILCPEKRHGWESAQCRELKRSDRIFQQVVVDFSREAAFSRFKACRKLCPMRKRINAHNFIESVSIEKYSGDWGRKYTNWKLAYEY